MKNYNKGEFVSEKFNVCVCDKIASAELSEEFTLPDYRSEIKKLLKIRTVIAPPTHYVGGQTLEISGNICYDVLYCGEDGQLYSVRIPSAYAMETALEGDSELSSGARVCAYVVPDNVTGRVVAPRKISLRTRLSAQIKAYALTDACESITGLDDAASLRRQLGCAEYAEIISACDESVSLSDEMIVDQRGGELRVICSEGQVFVSEAVCSAGGILCRGELLLGVMMCRDNGESLEYVTRKLPFTHEIAFSGAAPGAECRAWGECLSTNVSVGDGRLACEAVIALCGELQVKKELIYARDIYSTCAQAEVIYGNKQLFVPLRAANGNFTQNDVFDIAESGLPVGAKIICTDGHASPKSMAVDGRRCIMAGEIIYTILYFDGTEYGCTELVAPWKYEADMPLDAVDAAIDGCAELTVLSCRARMDGERISADSEVAVAWRACREDSIRFPEQVRFSCVSDELKNEMVVCYPEKSSTLWDVSRRYRADAEHICANNALTAELDDSLDDIKYLII